MTNRTGQMPEAYISDMSQNMILRCDPDGTIWAKITPVRRPGDLNPARVYINGTLYTVTSETFVKIFN